MELLDAIQHRRAVREYTSRSVDESVIKTLIDAAVSAPSAVNQQPWLFVIVRDQSLLDRISRESKKYMLTKLQDSSMLGHFRKHLSDPHFQIFYHAPALVLIAAESAGAWAVEDCALAAQNLMLAAHAAGLGSCWIGFAQGWLGTPEGKAALGLASECVPVAPIIIGYPKSMPASVPREPPDIRWVG